MVEEDIATSKVFVYEPDLISNIAEILQSDDPKTYVRFNRYFYN